MNLQNGLSDEFETCRMKYWTWEILKWIYLLTCDVKLFAFNFVFSKKIVYEQAKINFLLILRSVIEFSYIRSWLYLQDGLILTYLFGALNGRTNATNRQNDPRTDGQTKFFTKIFKRLRYLETYEFFFLILRPKKKRTLYLRYL